MRGAFDCTAGWDTGGAVLAEGGDMAGEDGYLDAPAGGNNVALVRGCD